MEYYSDIIIGGGPGGLFCALSVGFPEKRVLILEKKPQCGLKLLLSGSGQCNITHDGEISDFFSHYGDHGRFLKPALMNFSNRDLLSFFTEKGLSFTSEPGGKIFPSSRKGRDILEVLLRECTEKGVEIRCNEQVETVSKADDSFIVITGKGTYTARTLVIATGGITYPSTGSTGDGLIFSKLLGHPVIGTGPALTGILIQKNPFSDLSGISLADVPLSLFRDGKKVRQHTGDILFTHTGLSGPGILDLSRYMQPGDTLQISLLSGDDHQIHPDMLIQQWSAAGKKKVKTLLTGLGLPERLSKRILEIAGVDPDSTAAHLMKTERNAIFKHITAFPIVISGLSGIHEAMVTRGGASVTEINPKTMESRIVPGLFFAGEVMDIDGDCGGYNLQAAFSTGYQAAQGIAGYHRRHDPKVPQSAPGILPP